MKPLKGLVCAISCAAAIHVNAGVAQRNIIEDAIKTISNGVYSLVQEKYMDSDANKTVKSANNITLEEVFMPKPLMLAKN